MDRAYRDDTFALLGEAQGLLEVLAKAPNLTAPQRSLIAAFLDRRDLFNAKHYGDPPDPRQLAIPGAG